MALKQQSSKGLQNNDRLRSLNNRTQASLPPSLFIPVPYIMNETLILLYKEWNKGHFLYLKGFLLLLPVKVIIRALLLGQLSRERYGAPRTHHLLETVAGERNCFAGRVCKGPWVSTLFWVYLLLTRYSHCNPTRGWHNATSNIFGQDCGTVIRLWEWAKLHAHKMDYAEWCYSAAFEMQRQHLTELMWADANRNSSSCLAVRETRL